MDKRVAIYARLSVAKHEVGDESPSIGRQLQAGRQLAEARGWSVVLEASDDGVSATRIRPEDRPGWRSIMDCDHAIDAVIVWKIDRLARRVLDFLHADEALQARGAGIVAVEQSIDMTSPDGRAFAQMLAVFGEMEAKAISARVKAARDDLLRAGRVVGGTVPYGWRSIPNPDGPGLVLAHDPERIGYVREMADRVLAGNTIYSVKKWLDQSRAPLPQKSQNRRKSGAWAYSTIERLLRSPVLAGMTPYDPGRDRHQAPRPDAVLRDDAGLPIIDESVQILTPAEHRALLHILDTRHSVQAQPRASKGTTSPLLSRLVRCADCDRLMHRGTTQGRPSLSCPGCHQTISRLEQHVVQRLLSERGDQHVVELLWESNEEALPADEIEAAIAEVTLAMRHPDADVDVLAERLKDLRTRGNELRRASPLASLKKGRVEASTVRQGWENAETDERRRQILVGQTESIRIRRGKVGRYLDPERVAITWRT